MNPEAGKNPEPSVLRVFPVRGLTLKGAAAYITPESPHETTNAATLFEMLGGSSNVLMRLTEEDDRAYWLRLLALGQAMKFWLLLDQHHFLLGMERWRSLRRLGVASLFGVVGGIASLLFIHLSVAQGWITAPADVPEMTWLMPVVGILTGTAILLSTALTLDVFLWWGCMYSQVHDLAPMRLYPEIDRLYRDACHLPFRLPFAEGRDTRENDPRGWEPELSRGLRGWFHAVDRFQRYVERRGLTHPGAAHVPQEGPVGSFLAYHRSLHRDLVETATEAGEGFKAGGPMAWEYSLQARFFTPIWGHVFWSRLGPVVSHWLSDLSVSRFPPVTGEEAQGRFEERLESLILNDGGLFRPGYLEGLSGRDVLKTMKDRIGQNALRKAGE